MFDVANTNKGILVTLEHTHKSIRSVVAVLTERDERCRNNDQNTKYEYFLLGQDYIMCGTKRQRSLT